jgi:hypothetical protein
MTMLNYHLHSIDVSIAGPERVLSAFRARLEHLPAGKGSGGNIQFDCQTGDNARIEIPPGKGRQFLDPGIALALYFDDSEQIVLEDGSVTAIADLRGQTVKVMCRDLSERSLWVASHLCLTVPLAEMLKRHGLFLLHAAGLVSKNGGGLVVTGPSGSGKTTLAFALVRAGWGFLGDDALFIDMNGRAFAFPDEAGITPETAGFFPELKHLTQAGTLGGNPKHQVHAGRVYSVAPRMKCDPQLLVFPEVARSPVSRLEPMSKDEAIMRLMCNVLRTDFASSQAHLDALGQLVGNCSCYRLKTGTDFDRLSSLLNDAFGKDGQ